MHPNSSWLLGVIASLVAMATTSIVRASTVARFSLTVAAVAVPAAATYLYISRTRTADKLDHRIQEIVQKVEARNWASLKSDFTLPIRLFLTETLLEKGWNIVERSFGPLEGTGDPIITPGWLLITIKIPLKLQHAEYALQLQITPAGSLVGFHFTGLGHEWQVPIYAEKNAIEAEMVLGKGKFKVGATFCLPQSTESTSGSLSKCKSPCVVFIPGSGPCDRDSTISENKPFKDIALGLASQDIASIRFDKVTHTHGKAFSSRKDITLTDEYVEHAIDAIKQAQNHPDINPSHVFILGHSLGAVIAPKLADMNPSVAGCIIMAGPAEPIYKCFVRQLRYINSLDGPESLYLDKQIEDAQARAEIAESDDLTMSAAANKLPFGIGPAYWLDYRRFNPIETLKGLDCPALIMQGGRDYQVTAQDDYQQWRGALNKKNNVQFCFYEELNHVFVSGTGLSTPLEYSLQGNVDERVVVDIAEWVLNTSTSTC